MCARYEGGPRTSSLFRLEGKVVGLHQKTRDVLSEQKEFARQNGGRVDTSQRLKLQFILKTDEFSVGHSDFGMCGQECCSPVFTLPFFPE